MFDHQSKGETDERHLSSTGPCKNQGQVSIGLRLSAVDLSHSSRNWRLCCLSHTILGVLGKAVGVGDEDSAFKWVHR
eukprot:scaffold37600_cov176-Amphora_coffeaeformis.AAC.1